MTLLSRFVMTFVWFMFGLGILIAAMLLAAHVARAEPAICGGIERTKEQCEAWAKDLEEEAHNKIFACIGTVISHSGYYWLEAEWGLPHELECSYPDINKHTKIILQTCPVGTVCAITGTIDNLGHDEFSFRTIDSATPVPSSSAQTRARMSACIKYGNDHHRAPPNVTLDSKDDWLNFCMQQARYHLLEDCKKDLPENYYHEECWSRENVTVLKTRRRELPQ